MKLPLRDMLPIFLVLLFIWFTPLDIEFLYDGPATDWGSSLLGKLWGYGRLYNGLLIIALVIASPRFGSVLNSIAPLYPFAGFAVLSLAWAPDGRATFRQCVDMASLFFWIPATVQIIGLPKFLRISSLVAACALIASAAAAIFFPRVGVHQATDLFDSIHAGNWRGILGNKNSLGEFACMGFILLLERGEDEGWVQTIFWWTARASALACLIFSHSVTSQLGCVAAVLVYGVLRYRATSSPRSLILIAAAVALPCLLIISSPATLAALLGRDATFSGRTAIWSFTVQLVRENMWIGHGFNSADQVLQPLAMASVFRSATSAHSAYLDMLFDLGVVGLTLLVGTVLFVLFRGYRSVLGLIGPERRRVIIYMALLVSACVIAIGETAPFRPNGYGGIVFWLSILVLCNVKTPQGNPIYVWRRAFVTAPANMSAVKSP